MRSKLALIGLAVLLAATARAADPQKENPKQASGSAAAIQAPSPQLQQSAPATITKSVAPSPTPAPQPQNQVEAANPAPAPQPQSQVEPAHHGSGGNDRPGGDNHGGYGRDHPRGEIHRPRGAILDFGFNSYPVYEPYPVPYPVPEVYPAPSAPNPYVYVVNYGTDPVGGNFAYSLKREIQSYPALNLVSSPDVATLELFVISMDKDQSDPGNGSAVSVTYVWLPGSRFITSQMLDVGSSRVDENAASVAAYANRLMAQYR